MAVAVAKGSLSVFGAASSASIWPQTKAENRQQILDLKSRTGCRVDSIQKRRTAAWTLSLSPHLNVPRRMFSSQSSFFAMKPPRRRLRLKFRLLFARFSGAAAAKPDYGQLRMDLEPGSRFSEEAKNGTSARRPRNNGYFQATLFQPEACKAVINGKIGSSLPKNISRIRRDSSSVR